MTDEIKPCPKFQVGQRVIVQCHEAGMPSVYEAVVCCVDTDKQWRADYTVESDEYGRVDGYTDSWLSAIPDENRRATVSLETAQGLANALKECIASIENGHVNGFDKISGMYALHHSRPALARFEAERSNKKQEGVG